MLLRCALSLRGLSGWRPVLGREPAFSTSCAACSKNRRLRQKRVISEKKLVSACGGLCAVPGRALHTALLRSSRCPPHGRRCYSRGVTASCRRQLPHRLRLVLEKPQRTFSSCLDGIPYLLVSIQFGLKPVSRVAVWWCHLLY